MSQPLPSVDLSTYEVGQSGVIMLDTVKSKFPSDVTKATLDAHARIYNESGSVLQVWTDTGDTNEYVPAGGWITIPIDQAANEIHFTVVNQLASPPIQLLLAVYYKQGEDVPQIPTLGNSPIGGAVTTSGGTVIADHLINVGNPISGQPIINIEELGASGSQIFADNQGNFSIAEYIVATASLVTLFRTVMGVANGVANPNVYIGDVNHALHILSTVLIDKFLLTSGQITSTFANQGGSSASLYVDGLGNGGIGVDVEPRAGDSNYMGFRIFGNAASAKGFSAQGTLASGFDTSNMNSPGTGMIFGANNNPGIDLSAIVAGGAHAIKFPAGNLTRIVRDGPYTVTNVATAFNHSLGVVPDVVLPSVAGASSTALDVTYDFSTMTTTQVKLQCNIASLAPVYIVSIKF